ncbi:MAG: hydrogenase [Candidatus Binataceae bacterium]
MNQLINSLLVILVLTGFMLLGSSRLAACIRTVAVQGVLLGILGVAMQAGQWSIAGVVLPLSSAVVKGFVLPWLLFRAMREADTAREVEPFISYNLSILAGATALGLSLWLGRQLQLANQPPSSLLVPAAFFTSLVGMIVIVSRRKALTQVLGYLALENGVYAFGAAVALRLPILVELGILLDVFVGVFVMGIAIFHISREFDHIDTDKLTALTDHLR